MDYSKNRWECHDGSCCCISQRSSVAIISLLSMVVYLVDLLYQESDSPASRMKSLVDNMRFIVSSLFQLANVVLLLSSFSESPMLASLYIWYMLGFILMGLGLAILDLLNSYRTTGAASFVTFIPDVMFHFALSRCLPVVEAYRKNLV